VLRSAIITTPERVADGTMKAALRSLVQAGFMPMVVCDEFRDGCWVNYKRALRWMRGQSKPGDRIAIFEDDVRASLNLARWCEQVEIDGLVSMYTAGPNDHGGQGLTTIPCPRRCWGALAFLWTHEAIDSLLAFDPGKGAANKTDHWIGVWCNRCDVTLKSAVPSLIVHAGQKSTLPEAGQAEYRQCRRWRPDANEEREIDVDFRSLPREFQ